MRFLAVLVAVWAALTVALGVALSAPPAPPDTAPAERAPPAPATQTSAEADAKSGGCVSCHTASDQKTMHENPAVVLGCADSNGGSGSGSPVLVYSRSAMSLLVSPRTCSSARRPLRHQISRYGRQSTL